MRAGVRLARLPNGNVLDERVGRGIDDAQHGVDAPGDRVPGCVDGDMPGFVPYDVVPRREVVAVVTRVEPHLIRPADPGDNLDDVAIAGVHDDRLSVLQAAAE